jgi:hypothetical protein
VKKTYVAVIMIIAAWITTPAWAASFFFSTGNPDGKLGARSQQAGSNPVETETADDFILTDATVINSAVITGLIVPSAPLTDITNVEVELYHVFPKDSDVGRTSGPPSFSTANVPTRVNSPADVEIGAATRDGADGTLSFVPSLGISNFSVANSVINEINPTPNQKTGGEGGKTGQEVQIQISFTTPIFLPPDHYFFRPEAALTSGDFLYCPRPNRSSRRREHRSRRTCRLGFAILT